VMMGHEPWLWGLSVCRGRWWGLGVWGVAGCACSAQLVGNTPSLVTLPMEVPSADVAPSCGQALAQVAACVLPALTALPIGCSSHAVSYCQWLVERSAALVPVCLVAAAGSSSMQRRCPWGFVYLCLGSSAQRL
jgi:hypothetical protein